MIGRLGPMDGQKVIDDSLEILKWGNDIVGFAYIYDEEEDTIVIIPNDAEGNDLRFAAIAVSAGMLTDYLEKFQADMKSILDVRRTVRRARRNGIDPQAVHDRYHAIAIAEELDDYLRSLGGHARADN